MGREKGRAGTGQGKAGQGMETGNTCQADLLDKQACSVCQQAGKTGRQGRQASEQAKGNITGHYVAFYVSKAT